MKDGDEKRLNSYDGTILVDESGMIQSMNDVSKRLLGYSDIPKTKFHIQTILPYVFLHELSEGVITQHFGRHLEGFTFPVFIRMNTFELENKLFYLLVIQDIKDQSKLGKELYQPLNELVDLKFALDASTIVAITDQQGIIKYVNEKFVEISKYSAEELIGSDHRIVNSGFHSKEFIREIWKTISKGKVWTGEIKNRAKNGSFYWVDTTIVPFLDKYGKPYQYLAIRKDITEHKRVLEELERLVQELVDYKFALDQSSIVAITDHKGLIRYANEQFCKISKYSKEELVGQDHRIVNSGFHSKEFFKNLWKTIGQGKVWKGEIQNKSKDGKLYWVDTTIIPFLDQNGKPYQHVAIRNEITERKRIEKELQKMTTRIIDVQEEERKRLSRNLHDGVGQNLYSHLITINRISSEIDHPLLEQLQSEAASLIEEIRDISWELRPSVLDDLGLVPAIRSFINRFSEHYHIDVHFESNLKKRQDHNVETTIYRIIQESLTNSRKHAEVDKVNVSIKQLDRIFVMIEDEGKGFLMKNHASGVGIYSMEERARSIGGELTVKSSPGKGTKVVLSIPFEKTN